MQIHAKGLVAKVQMSGADWTNGPAVCSVTQVEGAKWMLMLPHTDVSLTK